MVSGVSALFPTAKVGHIGMYRDHITMQPHEYYCKLPDIVSQPNGISVVLDPMLATGGSAVAAIDLLKKHGATKIKLMNIIGRSLIVLKWTQGSPPRTDLLRSGLTLSERHSYILSDLCDQEISFFEKNYS